MGGTNLTCISNENYNLNIQQEKTIKMKTV